jgi:sugar lactone lactonase YvrE
MSDLMGSGQPGYAEGRGSTAVLNLPEGVFVTSDKLFFADTRNGLIREVALNPSTGFVQTSATSVTLVGRRFDFVDGDIANATLTDPRGIAIASNGNIFICGECHSATVTAFWRFGNRLTGP